VGKKTKKKKRISSEVGVRGVSPDEENEGYGGYYLQKKIVLSLA